MTVFDRFGNETPALLNSDEYKENYDRIFRRTCCKCGKSCKKQDVKEFEGLFTCKECIDLKD